MTIHWKAVEQYFTVVLFVIQFYTVCNFGKLINFGLGTVRRELYGALPWCCLFKHSRQPRKSWVSNIPSHCIACTVYSY